MCSIRDFRLETTTLRTRAFDIDHSCLGICRQGYKSGSECGRPHGGRALHLHGLLEQSDVLYRPQLLPASRTQGCQRCLDPEDLTLHSGSFTSVRAAARLLLAQLELPEVRPVQRLSGRALSEALCARHGEDTTPPGPLCVGGDPRLVGKEAPFFAGDGESRPGGRPGVHAGKMPGARIPAPSASGVLAAGQSSNS